jgi:outer membrane lipopolysaccharide assembly protein LptE/RlpB
MRTLSLFIALSLLALLLSACGYTMSKAGSQAGPMGGKYRVAVPLFVNGTYEPLVEKQVTSALKDELAIDGRWVLTDRGDADMLVSGKVTKVELLPLSYDAQERILEYRVRLVLDVKVTEVKSGKVLWKEQDMETFSDYRVIEDITKSKINKGEAINKASKNFAEEFIIKTLDIF